MSPAVAPIPPRALKDILCLHVYTVIAEDEYNWSLTDKTQEKSEPIIIPKIGDLVALDVMMQVLIDTKLNLNIYFALKERVLGKNWGYPAAPRPLEDRPN